MAQGSTPESAGSARPFKYHGNQGEFTLLAPFKPGGAERAREIAQRADEIFTEISDAIYGIGTLHDIRIALYRQRLSLVVRYHVRRRLGPVHRRLWRRRCRREFTLLR